MIMTVYISMVFFVIRLKNPVIKMVGGDCQKSTPVVLKKKFLQLLRWEDFVKQIKLHISKYQLLNLIIFCIILHIGYPYGKGNSSYSFQDYKF